MAVSGAGARTRASLLAAVTSLLDERGAEHVTITDVAVRAGVTRPTFYAVFGDLPTAFAEAAVARIADALAGEAVGEVPAGDRAEVMTVAIGRMLGRIAPHAEFFRRVLNGHGGHLVQQRVVALLAVEIRSNTPVSAALARGPLPVEVAATAIAAAIAWTMLDWFSRTPRVPVDELAEVIRDLLLHSVIGGLGAEPPGARPPAAGTHSYELTNG